MIKKKTCQNCKERIKGSPNFCSNCGIQLQNQQKKWGILGKNDSKSKTEIPKLFGGGISGAIMNKLISKMMNELAKSKGNLGNMTEQDLTETMKQLMPGVKITVKKNTPNGNLSQIQQAVKKEDTKFLPIEFNKNNLEKWKTLDKKEPKSSLRRIENKIQYEIEIPEVNSIKDISIIKLENSLEIRAIGKNEAYLKQIPIDLPLKKYSLINGLLTLEIDATN